MTSTPRALLRIAAFAHAAAWLFALAGLSAMPAARAQDDAMVPIAIPAQPDAIELGTGALPGGGTAE